ncbi:MAG: GNAT family N-acetyltransferase [Zoogloeaceae bacterium]|jgi:ribosomal protein S18 acetylase RimI-like enzyme|nr:GNAT family N-acetyltransferase [Zoogloeaceae bacterium]
MKPGIRVETADKTDIPALIELLTLLFSIEQDFHPDSEKQRRGLECLLDRPENGIVFVARDMGGNGDDSGGRSSKSAIGMVSAQLVISTASGAPSAWIEDVVLKPEYRKMGIGRQLLAAAAAWSRQKGARRLQLLADADNAPALKFYERLHWQPTRLFAWRTFI